MAELSLFFNLASVDKFGVALARAAMNIIEVGQESLLDMAEELELESLNQVPRASGALASSIFRQVIDLDYDNTIIRVGYGGDHDRYNEVRKMMTSEYMIPVHERLDRNHPVGKAKFLEDPVQQLAEYFEVRLGEEIRVRKHS